MAADTAVAICLVGMVGVLSYLAMSIDKNNKILLPMRVGIMILVFHLTWATVAYASVIATGISTAAAGILNSILVTLTYSKWFVNIMLFVYLLYWMLMTGKEYLAKQIEKKNGRKSDKAYS